MPGRDVADGDLHDRVAVEEVCGPWSPGEEGIELAACPPGGVGLERLAAGDHEDDEDRGDVLADDHGAHHGHDREDVEPEAPVEQLADHPDRGVGGEAERVATRGSAGDDMLVRGEESQYEDEHDRGDADEL